MATITFQLTKEIRQVLWANDCLGFDNVALAAEAIIVHEDYAERWEFVNPADVAAIDAWKCKQLISHTTIN